MECALCGRILKYEVEDKTIVVGHYNYRSNNYCMECWEKYPSKCRRKRNTDEPD
jgi:hypothetical protein